MSDDAAAYQRRLGKGNYWAAGLVLVKIETECPDLNGTAAHVLAVMASMTGTSERDKADPACFASQQAIGDRAGYGVRTVARALVELEKAGAIERVGKVGARLRATVRWRLTLLKRLYAKMADKQASGTDSAKMADKHSAKMADKHSAKMADNPSVSGAERRGAPEEEDRDAADAAASAGAPAPAAGPSTSSSSSSSTGIIGEIMIAKGCTQSLAEDYYRRKIADANEPVRNDTNYIRTCLENEAAGAASSAKKAGASGASAKGKGKGSKGAKSPASVSPARRAAIERNRVRGPIDPADKRDAVSHVVREGEDVAVVAERYRVTVRTVQTWIENAEKERRRQEQAEARQREQEAERQREQVELNRKRAQEKVDAQKLAEARLAEKVLVPVVPLPQPAVNGSARPWEALCQHAGCGATIASGRTHCERHRRPW